MTKSEFLNKLKIALTGKVSASLVEENMTYYSEYIDSQIRMGKSEEEVMNLLGDPRLIARTIVQTNGMTDENADETVYRESTSYNENYGNNYYRSNVNNSGSSYYSGQNNEVKVRTVPGWVWVILMIVIVVAVMSFLFSVVSVLLPLVFPILIVLFLIKLFRDWLN